MGERTSMRNLGEGLRRGQGEGGLQGTGRRPTYHTKDAIRAAIWSQKEARACVVV